MRDKLISIRSCPSQVAKLDNYVHSVITEFSIDQSRFSDILISLTEAVNNAIHHGNKADIEKCVDIQTCKQANQLVFTIRDEGTGFDPNAIKDPTSAKNIEEEGGRGVLIMKTLCDKITFKNNGSTVVMKFSL